MLQPPAFLLLIMILLLILILSEAEPLKGIMSMIKSKSRRTRKNGVFPGSP